ncbi:hypothetical protein L2E82_51141 [Cichorium intybus]|nr:hypothetical protein L2E82_51141 [Cichorium intybus]
MYTWTSSPNLEQALQISILFASPGRLDTEKETIEGSLTPTWNLLAGTVEDRRKRGLLHDLQNATHQKKAKADDLQNLFKNKFVFDMAVLV